MRLAALATIATMALLAGLAGPALAQGDPPDGKGEKEPTPAEIEAFLENKLTFQTGKVDVGSKLATIALPDGWRYLQAQDAQFMVEKVWGNPPNSEILGLVVPKGPLSGPTSWAIVVRYEDEGHTLDSDANDMNYDELLGQLQEGARQSAPERKKLGYPGIEVVGWAEPPHYDAAAKKLYWAKRLKFDDSPEQTLNYDVRILGRKGRLVMTAVAPDTLLAAVRDGCTGVLAATEFTKGNRYDEFNDSIDKTAAGGIAGLVLGGAVLAKAAKAGILAKFAKPIIIGVVALFSAVGRALGLKKSPPAAAK